MVVFLLKIVYYKAKVKNIVAKEYTEGILWNMLMRFFGTK